MRMYILLFLLLWTLTGCAAEVTTPTATAVAVAGTAAPTETTMPPTNIPISPTATAVPSNTPAPTPTATETTIPLPSPTPTLLTGPKFTYAGIQFTIDPAITTQLYPGAEDSTERVTFYFTPEQSCFAGCLRFYDRAAFADAAANSFGPISETLNTIESNIATETIGDYPYYDAGPIVLTHRAFFSTATLSGFRTVFVRDQLFAPANNRSLVYDYHGLTTDGHFYVNAVIPVSLPFLMSDPEPRDNVNENAILPPPFDETKEEYMDWALAYTGQMEPLIADSAESAFTPDLALVDGMLQSLQLSTTAATTATPAATATVETAVLTGPQINYDGVQLQLAPALAAQLYPAQEAAYEHVTFYFTPDQSCLDGGCLHIYDKTAFADAFSGFAFVVDIVESNLAAGAVGDFPTVGAAILLRAQQTMLDFGSGAGFRGIIVRGQDTFLVNNDELVYDYRGLTADGQFYVELLMPVTLPFLLSSFDPAANNNENAILPPAMPEDFDERFPLMAAYNAEMQLLIEEADPAAFTPTLTSLDTLMQSLQISPAD